ncbi:MAG: hypothetical protein Q9219_004581 [cf. Caloplaca sp. 3 TL-2023]
MVEYLYMGDSWTIGNPTGDMNQSTRTAELASLYVAADKYQMDGMKTIILKSFKSHMTLSKPDEWLSTADSIYSATSSADHMFRDHLRSQVVRLLDRSSTWPHPTTMKTLEKWIKDGGRLAIDINRACATYWTKKLNKRACAFEQLRKFREEERRNHSDNHSRCRKCSWAYRNNVDVHRELEEKACETKVVNAPRRVQSNTRTVEGTSTPDNDCD